MSFFKKLFEEEEEKAKTAIDDSNTQGKFRFPIVDDRPFNSTLKNRKVQSSEYATEAEVPSRMKRARHFRTADPVEAQPSRRVSRSKLKQPDMEQKTGLFRKKFRPLEVPPPMHLINQSNEPDEQVVFELPDLDEKWGLTATSTDEPIDNEYLNAINGIAESIATDGEEGHDVSVPDSLEDESGLAQQSSMAQLQTSGNEDVPNHYKQYLSPDLLAQPEQKPNAVASQNQGVSASPFVANVLSDSVEQSNLQEVVPVNDTPVIQVVDYRAETPDAFTVKTSIAASAVLHQDDQVVEPQIEHTKSSIDEQRQVQNVVANQTVATPVQSDESVVTAQNNEMYSESNGTSTTSSPVQSADASSALTPTQSIEALTESISVQCAEVPSTTVPMQSIEVPAASISMQHTGISEVVDQAESAELEGAYQPYQKPLIEFLRPKSDQVADTSWAESQAQVLDSTLMEFNVNASVVDYAQGPSVTRFEIQPEPGVKVSKITNLSDDLKLSLAARDIRIEAPIPGKRTVGIEIPNRDTRPVFIREILEEDAFQKHPSPLAVAVGLDISGEPIATDLVKMPHGLVAGSTGSGKSVFINSLLISLLYKSSPDEVKFLLIDPKMVELNSYNGIPHLVSPVVTDPKVATAALKWAVEEMERRYDLFAKSGVRDIVRFNDKAKSYNQATSQLPYIVIVIDELADLMMTAPVDVEEAICRIAQKARAAGMHLIVATQRPSVDVITGLIKANIPTRIAFSVSAQTDSRTILDQGGAEKLLGRGDMLFLENGTSKSVRLQGTYVSDDEIEEIVDFVKRQAKPNFLFAPEDLMKAERSQSDEDSQDPLFLEACRFAVEVSTISTSSLQRKFRVGYNRAARMIDVMEQYGVVSAPNGSKPRTVLISYEDLDTIKDLIAIDNG